ncbi:MAG: dTDP-4-dehydrorhamnose 3,5-epimerase [Alphaproteobacteria bacterium]|nr:MAG: dTDP-4-dehydrorhamnose 3,5-epimerase [Alphaproteobacteria bacterium]
MLKATLLAIADVILLTPTTRSDHRGDFTEIYNVRELATAGIHESFVVDNHVRNVSANVLRGLHYQREPFGQAKLLRVTRGSIFDVAVDIRPTSPTFGKHVGVTLTADSMQLLYVPNGFAHGFCGLEDGSEVHYKVSSYADPAQASGILWDDAALGIQWPLAGIPILAERDTMHPTFSEFTAGVLAS